MTGKLSELKMISYGVVAEHKIRDTKFNEGVEQSVLHPGKVVELIPMEWLPSKDLEVNIDVETITIKGVDKYGATYNTEINSSKTLPAEWLPFDTNRITAPDLRIGERVMIWQYAGADKYYWSSIGKDDNLRKLESVIWAISATMDETDTTLTRDNTYFISISSHDKALEISTSSMNGEPFRYNIKLDTEAGNLVVKDTDGNSLVWDTANTSLKYTNREGTYFDVNLKNFFLYTPDKVQTLSKGESIFESKKLMSLICPEGIIGDSGLEPSLLGDKMSEFLTELCDKLDQHKHVGNMGAPTSALMALGPLGLQSHYTKTSGTIFSKKLQNF